MNGENKHFAFGPFRFDLEERTLLRDGRPIPLSPKITETLLLLLQNAGHLVDKDKIIRGVWPDTFVEEGNLNRNIFILRKTLGQWDGGREYIETVPRRGYRFVAPVEDLPAGQSEDTGATEISVTPPPIEGKNEATRHASMFISLIFGLGILAVGGMVIVWSKLNNSPPKIVSAKQITNNGFPKTSGPVSDGSRIYFGEFSGGRNVLKEVSNAGGETEEIQTSLPDPLIEDFSPEDSQLLAQTSKDQWNQEGSDFWLIPVPRGTTRRMGVIGRAGGWVRGPNGQFYFGKSKDLYIANHDGSNAHKIATAPGQVTAIQASPDGSRLRFTVSDLGKCTHSIWEVRLDGSGVSPLLSGWNNPAQECCGTWTPDGHYYFFQSLQNVHNIWLIRQQTGIFAKSWSAPVQLATPPTTYGSFAFGKDNTPIFAFGEQKRAELVAFDRKSANFVPFMGGISAGDLDFSRDGKWVAYVTYPDGLLWRSRVDGSDRLQLTFPPTRAALVHWSPDARQIAFSLISLGKPWKISLIERDGGSPQELTADDLVETDPNWSPDGNTLAYGVYVPGRPDQSAIRLLDLKTRASRQLPGSVGVCFPRWAPNGRYLVAETLPDDTKLRLFDFKTNKWRDLVSNVGTIAYFSWSSDSKYLYFDNLLTDDPSYLRVRIVDSKLEQITSLKSLRRYISDFEVPYSGLAPGEIPLFARDTACRKFTLWIGRIDS